MPPMGSCGLKYPACSVTGPTTIPVFCCCVSYLHYTLTPTAHLRSWAVQKQMRTWPAGAISALQDCFENTDWDMFSGSATNGNFTDLEEYTACKAELHLCFLRKLRKAQLPLDILKTFYRGTIESILSRCITVWFGNCTVSERKSLQQIVRTAVKIIWVSLPSVMDIYTTCCIRKAISIVADHTHPSHTVFTLLLSERRYRSIWALTSRLCNSFIPQAIKLLNTK